MNEVLDEIWDRVVGGLDWLKQVILGEFQDNRDLSAVVADMLVSFVPGVVIVTSARDLTAVILRLAKRPERRELVEEWMLLIACAVPLVLPILAAAAGAAAAGVGAIIGGIAGSEAGAVLRAVCLLLIKKGQALIEVVGLLRRFVKGDILKVLRDIQFAKYSDALVKYLGEFIEKLVDIIRRVKAELLKINGFNWLAETLAKLDELEQAFYAVQSSAVRSIPKAMAELDIRLQHVLSQSLPHNPKPAIAGVPPGQPTPVPAQPTRVPTMSDNPLGRPDGTTLPNPPPKGEAGPNLHPETPREPKRGPDEAAKAARQKRLQELAADPAHGGKVDAKGMREAEVGLSLEERGVLKAPIRRDPSGSAEFIDASGQKWDVKAWNSKYAPKGYNTNSAIASVKKEVAAGENVIVDTANMSAEHVADLKAALASEGLSDKVIFH